MGTSILGLLLAVAIVLGSIFEVAKNRLIFLSLEGLLIVLGGTLAAALITFPFKKILSLLRVVVSVFKKEMDMGPQIVKEIVSLAQSTRGDRGLLLQSITSIKNPFLKEAVELIVEKMAPERIETILKDRIRIQYENDENNSSMLKNLGKYPPAFGLLATVIALVSLLERLGNDVGGSMNLGPSMAVGLVGTMYGIVMANFVFGPMSENLLLKSFNELRNRQIVLVGVMLLKAEESPRVIQESLNSLLDVAARVNMIDGQV